MGPSRRSGASLGNRSRRCKLASKGNNSLVARCMLAVSAAAEAANELAGRPALAGGRLKNGPSAGQSPPGRPGIGRERPTGRLMVWMLVLGALAWSDHASEYEPSGANWLQAARKLAFLARAEARTINVKLGALLEESDHEQANMFIRTIKMINERKEPAIRRLLNISTGLESRHQNYQSHQSQQQQPSLVSLAGVGSNVALPGGSPSGPFSASNLRSGQPGQPDANGYLSINRDSSNNNSAGEQEVYATPSLDFAGWTVVRVEPDRLPAPARGQSGKARWQPSTSEQPAANDGASLKLEPIIEYLENADSSFEADKKVCQLIESGVLAILGPTEGASIQHVQSICDNMEVPYFQLRPPISSSRGGGGGGGDSGGGSGGGPQAAGPIAQAAPSDSLLAPAPLISLARLQQTSRDDSSSPASGRRGHSHHQNPSGPSLAPAAAPISGLALADGRHYSKASMMADMDSGSQEPDSASQSHGHFEELNLNLYPPAHLLTAAYMDLISAWNWTSFAIVYEDDASMVKLQDMFHESSAGSTSKWQIKLFQLRQQQQQQQQASSRPTASKAATNSVRPTTSSRSDFTSTMLNSNNNDHNRDHQDLEPSQHYNHQQNSHHYRFAVAASEATATKQAAPGASERTAHLGTGAHASNRKSSSFRDLFWRIKASGEHNVLLDVSTKNLYSALKQAQQVGCMSERYSYLITSLDLHTIDLENFIFSRTKITAFSLINLSKFAQPSSHSGGGGGGGGGGSISSGPSQSKSPTWSQEQHTRKLNHLADESYLEKLGVRVLASSDGPLPELGAAAVDERRRKPPTTSSSIGDTHGQLEHSKLSKLRLSPSIVLERSGQSSYLDPPAAQSDQGSFNEGDLARGTSLAAGYVATRPDGIKERLFELYVNQQDNNLSRFRLSTTSAIMHDSLVLYTLGLNELDPNGKLLAEHQKASCSQPNLKPWSLGSSLVNYMYRLSFTGLTGHVSFDQRGLRSEFKLNVLGVAPDIGLVKIGEWHSAKSLGDQKLASPPVAAMSSDSANSEDQSGNNKQEVETGSVTSARSASELIASNERHEAEFWKLRSLIESNASIEVQYKKQLKRSGALHVNEIIFEHLYLEQVDKVDTLIVTTKLSQPYFMLKETPNRLEGNDQYEGFAVDLIHELSKLINFKYRWREVADKKYGSRELLPNGSIVWNGMIGEIVRGLADVAIVDLTITSQREEAVDFTLPFMNTGISILFKKPTTKVTTLYSFLSPFSTDVWGYVLCAYCGISGILFFVGHMSPYEWADPHPCPHLKDSDEDTSILRNQFTLPNAFWFTIGSLMQQGSDLTPRSMSTRTIAGIWYFFTLIMISSYTANLAAFLTVEKVVFPIENVKDLANQHEIKYGCVESGTTCTFFHDSQIDTYRRINETMHKYRSYVKSNDEGQKRVEEGKFAFFMESTSIEYIVERNCNLTQIGGLLDSKGYGLATSKKSRLKRPYRTLLSEGILHLQETGMLHILKNRWWKEKRGGGTCTDDGKGGGVTELSLANVGGVFVVLVGGLCVAFVVSLVEFLWRSRRFYGLTRNRLCDQMMNDLKFALNCTQSVKIISKEQKAAKRAALEALRSHSQSQSQSDDF